MSLPPDAHANALAQYNARYGKPALFLRYARVRMRQIPIRQVATVFGSIGVWHIVSPAMALVCIGLALVGEAVDAGTLLYAQRRVMQGGGFDKALEWLTALSGGLQSATIASCVMILLLMAPTTGGALVALFFLATAIINAGLVLSHHKSAAWTKMAVLLSCIPIYLVILFVSARETAAVDQLIIGISMLMLFFVTFTFLDAMYRSWQRRLANEWALMEGTAKLDAANGDLVEAQQQAEQAAQAKSAFLATMSHEIRTPLNAVVGMCDLLSEREMDKEGLNQVETIRTASTALLQIINDVLDLSRLEADRMTFEARPFDLAECIRGAVSLLTPLAREKGLHLVLEGLETLPRRASADAGRLRQILVNLLGNAIKFSAECEIHLSATALPEEGGWRLVIRVQDTGIGVPMDRAEAIFEEFRQADTATTRRYGGTGLGLPISRAMARHMGGDIRLQPPGPHPGACFELSLRLDASEEPAEEVEQTAISTEFHAPLSVLLADDNATNRLMVRSFLKDMPVALEEAVDGREAVEMCRHLQPDVVLMDMSMPELDGLQASRAIRALPIRQPMIVAITANAFESDRQACRDAGMEGFLSKPLRKAVLLGCLADLSRGEKPLSHPGGNAVSGQDAATGREAWTSPPESGTTSGKSIRSSGR